MGKRTKPDKKAAQAHTPESAKVVALHPGMIAEVDFTYGEHHPNWLEFAETYSGSPALDNDTVYALPDFLISAIVTHIPDFFSKEELQFERDLARLAGAGFFLKSPFGYPRLSRVALEGTEATREKELQERLAANSRRIRELLEAELRGRGRTQEEIRRSRREELDEKGRIEIRQRGYAGWLVTNTKFRQDRDAFRKQWGTVVEALGGFPRLPMSLMGEAPSGPREQYQDFYSDYMNLCVTWGLDGLVTWDLPSPMRPEMSSPSLYHLPAIREAGVTMFVPWYLLRDRNVQLNELANRLQMLAGPENLKEWLNHKPKGWGYERFAVMLEIYILIELCLKSRYAQRLKRNVGRLVHALGYYFCLVPKNAARVEAEAESVRKIRQALNRRLKVCAACTPVQ